MSASALLLPCSSCKMHGFGPQTLSAAWTPALCSQAQPSYWPALSTLSTSLGMSQALSSKHVHPASHPQPVVCRQLTSRVLGDSLLAAHRGVWERNRRLAPQSLCASLLLLSNLWLIYFSFGLSIFSFLCLCHANPQDCFWLHTLTLGLQSLQHGKLSWDLGNSTSFFWLYHRFGGSGFCLCVHWFL